MLSSLVLPWNLSRGEFLNNFWVGLWALTSEIWLVKGVYKGSSQFQKKVTSAFASTHRSQFVKALNPSQVFTHKQITCEEWLANFRTYHSQVHVSPTVFSSPNYVWFREETKAKSQTIKSIWCATTKPKPVMIPHDSKLCCFLAESWFSNLYRPPVFFCPVAAVQKRKGDISSMHRICYQKPQMSSHPFLFPDCLR